MKLSVTLTAVALIVTTSSAEEIRHANLSHRTVFLPAANAGDRLSR